MCIVYLLRRRAFDDDFLSLDSDLHHRVKDTFESALVDVKSKRLRPIGGIVNLENELGKIIKFIDRVGDEDGPIDMGET